MTVGVTPDVDYWDPPTAVDNDGNPMLNGTGPTFMSNPWDIVFINGTGLPGVCKVHGTPTLSFDKKKHGGSDGAIITVNGYIPGPIDIEILLWTQAQWEFFLAMAPTIWTKPAKKIAAAKVAVTVGHPAFATWGITQVVIIGVSVPENGPVPQSKLIKIKCVEYVPIAGNKSKTVTKAAPQVKEDPRTSGANNGLGDPPSKTDIGPRGPKPPTLPGG